MKTVKIIPKTIYNSVVTSLTCDCCGKTKEGDNLNYDSDIINIELNFGYGSVYDTDKWSMDVCDECITKWVLTFKHDIDKIETY